MKFYVYYLKKDTIIDEGVFADHVYAYTTDKIIASVFEEERDMNKFSKKVAKIEDEFEIELFNNRNGSKELKIITVSTIKNKYTKKEIELDVYIVANEMEVICLDYEYTDNTRYVTDIPTDIFRKDIRKSLCNLQYREYHNLYHNTEIGDESAAPQTKIDELALYILNLSDLYKI